MSPGSRVESEGPNSSRWPPSVQESRRHHRFLKSKVQLGQKKKPKLGTWTFVLQFWRETAGNLLEAQIQRLAWPHNTFHLSIVLNVLQAYLQWFWSNKMQDRQEQRGVGSRKSDTDLRNGNRWWCGNMQSKNWTKFQNKWKRQHNMTDLFQSFSVLLCPKLSS